MGSKLSGFLPVFKYTLKNQLTSKKYIIVTIIFAILLMGGISSIFVLVLKPEETKEFNIEKVVVVDETGTGVADYKAYGTFLEDDNLKSLTFETADSAKKAVEANKDKEDFVIVIQQEKDDQYYLNIIKADNTIYDDDVLDMLGDSMKMAFQFHIYEASELSEEALANAIIPVKYDVYKFNSDEDEMKDIIEIIIFMGLLFIIYMMTLMYGQQICTEVSLEKNSKLVEQLLVSVTPYGLISGKVFAIILASILQFFIWIVSAIAGIFGGDKMAQMFYPDYDSQVDKVLDLIKTLFGDMAFDVSAVILAVLLMLVGIVVYLVLAGFAGSMVTKPEDAASVQIYFVFPILISFFVDLTMLTEGEGTTPDFLHFIPFTAAMITPAAVLLGSIPLWMGIVSFIITVALSIALMLLAAKIYKGLLFFSGKKVTPKVIINSIKSKK